MSVFDLAMNALFNDPNLGVDAVWRAGGAGDGLPVRIILKRPQEIVGYRDSRFELPATLVDVRLSEVTPAKGDTVTIGAGPALEIIGLADIDSGGLVRTCEAAPVAP